MTRDLSFSTIRELGCLLRRRTVSVVELAEHFLGRLEQIGPKFNAVVTVTRELALEQARAAGQRLIDEHPRSGAGGRLVAFVHPAAARGVLIELVQAPQAR